MPTRTLLLLAGLVALPAAAQGAAPTGCPTKVARVEVETGHYDPPATLVPDVSRKGGRYQAWTGLSKSMPREDVTITCHAPGKKSQLIVLPRRVDRCVLDAGRMTCR